MAKKYACRKTRSRRWTLKRRLIREGGSRATGVALFENGPDAGRSGRKSREIIQKTRISDFKSHMKAKESILHLGGDLGKKHMTVGERNPKERE